jgi:hypothetical protein
MESTPENNPSFQSFLNQVVSSEIGQKGGVGALNMKRLTFRELNDRANYVALKSIQEHNFRVGAHGKFPVPDFDPRKTSPLDVMIEQVGSI